MRDELAASANVQHRPTFTVRFYAIPDATRPLGLAQSEQIRAWLAQLLAKGLGLPVRTTYVQNASPTFLLRALDDDSRYKEKNLTETKVVVAPDIEKHLKTLAGAPYGSAAKGTALNVWVLSSFDEELGLAVGEKYWLTYPASSLDRIEVQIAGIVQAVDANEEYWYQPPDALLSTVLLTTVDGYNTHLAPILPKGAGFIYWYFVIDDARVNLSYATRYIKVLETAQYEVEIRLPNGSMDIAPLEELVRARERKRNLSLDLTALTLPLLIVLIQFMVIVSSTYARSCARHEAMVTTRGASRGQLLLLTFGEAIVCMIVALPLGLVLGIFLANILGMANGFLSFTMRDTAPVFIAALDWQPIVAAVVIGVLTRLWATSQHANLTIVTYERHATGRMKGNTGLRLLLIVLLGAISIYTYQQLVANGGVPLVLAEESVTLTNPLLLLAPSLFLVVVTLFLAESTSFLVGIFSKLLDPVLSAPVLVAIRQLARDRDRSRVPVFVLVISLSLGVFYASLAYSSQIWMRDRLRQSVGADLAFDHATLEGQASGGGATGADAWQLPAQDYEQIEGVVRATRVANYLARTQIGRSERRIRLIGIERLSFPAVAYFRFDYSSVPMGELMNRLALKPHGALVPEAIARQYGLKIGDPLSVVFSYEEGSVTLDYEIVGIFDYFPTIMWNELAMVVNIDTIFEGVGQVLPHSIWIRTSPSADVTAIMTMIGNRGVVTGRPRVLGDLKALEENRREYIGALGMMSVSFLASLLVAAVGALVHLFAGLVLHKGGYALLRGIGFHLREIMASVLLEYAIIINAGIGWGASVGLAASQLYGRYILLIAPSASTIPPFIAYSDVNTTWWIMIAMAITTLAIVTLVSIYLRRQRIFEVLRMG
ncbi:MAG: hypothetical protein E4H07_08805 [Nitrosomonadales bacterium]|nr:MAG: hypothetical protein E4H07_08805 [Nitrosomonadales bacterium]